jgi:hypothetical protein
MQSYRVLFSSGTELMRCIERRGGANIPRSRCGITRLRNGEQDLDGGDSIRVG